MHLITTAILISLASFSGMNFPLQRRKILPSFKGIIEHKHHIPGRYRFHIPSLMGNSAAIDILRDKLPVIPGVISADADIRSGSLIVSGSDTMDPNLLLAAVIKLLGLEEEVEKTPVSGFSSAMTTYWHVLNRSVYEQSGGAITANDAVGIVLLGASLLKFWKTRKLGIPSAFTLLWWFFNMQNQEGSMR